jgi:hypothetical protein
MSDVYEKIGELRDELNAALEALLNIWDLTQPRDPYLLIRAEVVKGLGCAAPSGMEIAQREADEAAGDKDPRDKVLGVKPELHKQGQACWCSDCLTARKASRDSQNDASVKS